MSTERCCQGECEELVKANRRSRCGGKAFGTRRDPGYGCGRFFCDDHLFGLDPYYCAVCLAAMKFSLGLGEP